MASEDLSDRDKLSRVLNNVMEWPDRSGRLGLDKYGGSLVRHIWRKIKFRQGEQQFERPEDRAFDDCFSKSKQHRVAGTRRAKEKGVRPFGEFEQRSYNSDLVYARVTLAPVWRPDQGMEIRVKAETLVSKQLLDNFSSGGWGCGIEEKWSLSLYISKAQ